MDVVATVRARAQVALTGLAAGGDVAPERVSVQPAAERGRGDLVVAVAQACRGAGVEARRRIAEGVAEALATMPQVAGAAATGAGLVDVTLSLDALEASLAACLAEGFAFGRGAGALVLPVGLAPARAQGAVGLGRARAAVVADALSRILAFAGHPAPPARDGEVCGMDADLARLGVAPRFGGVLPENWPGHGRAILVHEAERGAAHPVATAATVERVAVAPCRLVTPGVPQARRDAPLHEALALADGAALRYALLSCRPGQGFDLDPRIAADASHAGPVFDVRYAHARARGLIRRAATAMPEAVLPRAAPAPAGWPGSPRPEERHILRCLALYPDRIAAAAALRDPSRVVIFLAELARAVHGQWKSSKDQPQLRFVNEEQRDLTKARLGLVTAAALVLHSGLDVLGVSAPDEMR